MSKITQIQQDNNTKRVVVYIDYRFCASIRQNVWQEMNLREGSEITCAKLREKERVIWRRLNRKTLTHITKQAIDGTVQWFAKHLPSLETKIIDFRFGNDSGDSRLMYPTTRNDQNLSILLKGTNTEVITLEVASTEVQRGLHYWVRLDKIAHAQSQKKRDAWVILYYKYPAERLIWIKPDPNKAYRHEELINSSKIYFIPFNDKSPEVYSQERFCNYIQRKVDKMAAGVNTALVNPEPLSSMESATEK